MKKKTVNTKKIQKESKNSKQKKWTTKKPTNKAKGKTNPKKVNF